MVESIIHNTPLVTNTHSHLKLYGDDGPDDAVVTLGFGRYGSNPDVGSMTAGNLENAK